MSVATTVLLLAGGVLAAKAVLTWWRGVLRMARVAASIPGPPAHPMRLGNLLDLPSSRVRPWFKGLMDQYGLLLRLWFGHLLVVFVMDAKDVEAVVTSSSCSAKPWPAYRLLEPVLGKGMLLLNGSEFRRHRKLILPSLHRDNLTQFQPLMQRCFQELVETLAEKAASGEVFDVVPLCGVAALNATYRTILNADEDLYEATRGQRRLVVENTTRLTELLWYRVLRPWCHPDWLFRVADRRHDEMQRITAMYDRLILDVLDNKLALQAAKAEPKGEPKGEPRRRQGRRSFVDIIVSSEEGRSLAPEEVFAEVKTMVAASFATSMDVISVVLLVLSLMPDELARVHRELDDVLGDRCVVEAADLDHLGVLERVIKEALRYFPPFPVLGRTCDKDLKLPSGHTLPAGCNVALLFLATHWNPEYYPEPTRFDPDRFLPEAVAARPACAFMPFSAGARGCIGERYAFMLIKTCLATVLRRFDVLPDPDGPKDIEHIRMTISITFHPKSGCRIRLRERQRQRPSEGG